MPLKVLLVEHTPNPEELIAKAAKLCYSAVGIEEMNEDISSLGTQKFLNMLASMGHESPMEHVSFTFAVEGVSRSLTHQLVRHRLASYCVSKDTKISTSSQKTDKKTIEELFNLSDQYKSMINIKCVDESNGQLNYNKMKSIVHSGVKSVYHVETKHGYSIKTTLEHRFYTSDGWKRLKDLNEGDFVYINGESLYKDVDWLKKKYHDECLSHEEIGLICGVSHHTIRAWIRKHRLQKELGSWSIGVEPPNKGETKDTYEPLKRVSLKMFGNTNAGDCSMENNNAWKGDDISISGGYSRSNRWKTKTGMCELCGFDGQTENHHIDVDPLNNSDDNLIELCVACHKAIHRQEQKERIILSEIIAIEYAGEEDTYDIEMMEPHHNFIANGFVVHNSQQSQRYVKLNQFEYVVPPAIKESVPAMSAYVIAMEAAQTMYDRITTILNDKYISEGMSKSAAEKKAIEDARYVFPNACETKIIVTMNVRSLLNFFHHRCCNRAQWEIRELASQMLMLVKEVAPTIFKYAGPSCVSGPCPEALMTCGQSAEMRKKYLCV